MKTERINSIIRAPRWRGFLLIPLAFAFLILPPQARAACQEGCDLTHGNTVLGEDALEEMGLLLVVHLHPQAPYRHPRADLEISFTRNLLSTRTSTLDGWTRSSSNGSMTMRPASISARIVRSLSTTARRVY